MDKEAQITVKRDELNRKILYLEKREETIRAERLALEDEESKLRREEIGLRQTMILQTFETRLKKAQEQENEQQLDILVALLCEIRNHFNQTRYTVFVPGKRGNYWATIENQNLNSNRTSIAWGITKCGDAYAIRFPTEKVARFNIFTVTMDTLKVELLLNLRCLV